MVSLPHVLLFVVCLLLLPLTEARSLRNHRDPNLSNYPIPDSAETSVRTERSANISHIRGTSRKIQLIVNEYWRLQIFPDGTVNGSDSIVDSAFSILRRSAVTRTQIRIQGVVTCMFLCMDSCGLLYATKYYTEECVFNEMIAPNHFNMYSSVKYSNDKRTLYLAVSKKGIPRKIQTKPEASLGKQSTFTKVLTRPVLKQREDMLLNAHIASLPESYGFSNLPLRHHGYHHFCTYYAENFLETFEHTKCHRQQKKKKKKKCDGEGTDDCLSTSRLTPAEKKKCEDGEEEEECQRRLHMIRKKRKSRTGEIHDGKPEEATLRRKRLKAEKKDSSDKNFKIREQCSSVSRNNKRAYNDCILKKDLKKKLKLERSVGSPSKVVLDRFSEEVTEELLWQDELGHNDNNLRSTEETTPTIEDYKLTTLREEDTEEVLEFSSDWTNSAGDPN